MPFLPRIAGFLFLGLIAATPALAAQPKTTKLDALCQGMVDAAGNPWPVKQITQCGPWRQQRQVQLDGALQQCKTAHTGDDNFDACAIPEEASTKFWERAQELDAQNPDHVVTQLPNPILPPARDPLEDRSAGTHVSQ